jgi:hypothetical protein
MSLRSKWQLRIIAFILLPKFKLFAAKRVANPFYTG